MLNILIILFVLTISSVQCEDRQIYRRKYDAFLKKIEEEFPGYQGRPMPPELLEMIQNHKKVNDEVEECMFDFSECMAVKKSYPFCAYQETTDEAMNVTTNVTKWFKNICEFAYRLCRDGENSWISLPTIDCDHLVPNDTEDKDAQLTDHKHELDLFGNVTVQDKPQNQNPADPNQNSADPNQNIADPNQNPTDPNQNPADPNQNPADPNQNPADPNQNIADPNQNPGDPNQNPADPNQNSADPNQNPTNQNQNPSDPNQNPADPNQNPGDPNESPATQNQNPSDPNQNPAEQNQSQPLPPASFLRGPYVAEDLNARVSKITGPPLDVQITNITTNISQEKKSELMSLLAKVQKILV